MQCPPINVQVVQADNVLWENMELDMLVLRKKSQTLQWISFVYIQLTCFGALPMF